MASATPAAGGAPIAISMGLMTHCLTA